MDDAPSSPLPGMGWSDYSKTSMICSRQPCSVAELEPHLARSAVRLDPEKVDATRELVDELHARLVVEGGDPQRRSRVVPPLDLVGASRAGHAEARREVGRMEVPGRGIDDGVRPAADRVDDVDLGLGEARSGQ